MPTALSVAQRRNVVRLTWLDCAAADAHPPVEESGVDLLLDMLRGSPLFPPLPPIPAPPPLPLPLPAAFDRVKEAEIDKLKEWVADIGRYHRGPGAGRRKDLTGVWHRRARWAWEHHARGKSWAAIAREEGAAVAIARGKSLAEVNEAAVNNRARWHDVMRDAKLAVAVGCDGSDRQVIFDGLRGMMQAYTDLGSPEPRG